MEKTLTMLVFVQTKLDDIDNKLDALIEVLDDPELDLDENPLPDSISRASFDMESALTLLRRAQDILNVGISEIRSI